MGEDVYVVGIDMIKFGRFPHRRYRTPPAARTGPTPRWWDEEAGAVLDDRVQNPASLREKMNASNSVRLRLSNNLGFCKILRLHIT